VKISLHVSTVTPACSLSLNRTTTVTSHLSFILPFPHGWRRWVRHLGRGQASCRTLSASILLVHPLRPSKALLVLRHVPPLRPLPSYLLPSFPSLARDQLPEVSPVSQIYRVFFSLISPPPPLSGQHDGDMASPTLIIDRSMLHTLPPSPPAKRTKLAKISNSVNVLLKRLPPHRHPRASHSL